MRYILTIILLHIFIVLIAQCPPGSVDLDNQTEVDNFLQNYPNCNYINGGLNISGNSSPKINDLSGLACLDSVKNAIEIRSLDFGHSDLSFLRNIVKVGSKIELQGCDALTTLDGMDKLESVWRLDVGNCHNLLSLGTFPSLTSLGVLNVYNSDSLLSLFDSTLAIDRIYEVSVRNSFSVTNLSGLENVQVVGLNINLT